MGLLSDGDSDPAVTLLQARRKGVLQPVHSALN
jgi:hypothetical protein